MPILDWIGKKQVINHDKEVPFRLLKKVESLSVGESENLIIKGDNLEALKALLPYYYNKVKCIYIDPPYNTGNENWIYNDKVNSPEIKKWLGRVVGSEGEDLSRHDKWLCMMYPRIIILRELLADDGVIFVSIDDNEVHHLRMLMNEVFGANNFVGQTVRVSSPTQNIAKFISIMHDYALAYCKKKENNVGDWEVFKNNYEEFEGRAKKLLKMGLTAQEIEKELKELVKYPRFYDFDHFYNCDKEGVYQTVSAGGVKKGNTKTQILHPATKKPCKIPQDGWRYKEEEIRRMEKENLWHYGEDENTIPRKKLYLKDYLTQNPKGINFFDTQKDIRFLREIGAPFDFPKPIEYIKHLIRMVTKSSDIILDSFAGSGTTAHAVLGLNREDGGNRKFILVEMVEEIARKVTAERVKRVIKGYSYKNNKGESIKVEGLGGGFQFMNLDTELFNAHGLINDDISYTDLARYIFFSETKLDLKEKAMKDYFIGDNNGAEYYLVFKQGKENILNEKIVSKLKKTDKKKVVYADNCTLDSDMLNERGITFKQIPYEVRAF